MRMTTRAIVLSVTLAVGVAARGGALPGAPGGLPDTGVQLDADLIERVGTTVYMMGHVRLQRGKAVVTADAAVVWTTEREAYLEGNVVYWTGRASVTADSAYVHWTMSVDAETGKTRTQLDRGFFFHADVRWHEGPDKVAWRVHADEVLQTDPTNFIGRGGAFVSPNPFHKPHTYFRASQIQFVVGDKLILDNIRYLVQGVSLPLGWQGVWVPPTYWPKLYIPLSWEWPEMSFDFGTSRRFGTYLRTRVVYDVPQSLIPLLESKVGVDLDYFSQRGIAYGADWRYRYEDSVEGRLDFYRVPSDSGEDYDRFELGTTERDRYRLYHMHDLIDPDGTRGWEFDAELARYSDAGFRQEYFRGEYEEEKPIENRLYAKYFDGPFSAYAHARWQGDEWLETTEYLPQVGVNLISHPLWGSLVYSASADVALIRRRLSNLRMPFDTLLVNPGGTLTDEDDDEDTLDAVDYEYWEDINDRDDLADILGEDHKLVRRLLDENFIHCPLRNTLQEELSDDEDFLRFNTYHELSMPLRWGIWSVRPFLGTRQTYYGDTVGSIDVSESGDLSSHGGGSDWRSLFVGGVRAATQFWSAWDDRKSDALRLWGRRIMPLEINGLRHVITPEFRVLTITTPSVEADELILVDDTDVLQPIADAKYRHRRRRYSPRDTYGLAFGDVDALDGVTTVSLGLRNRWQTRREQIIFTEDLEDYREMTPEELAEVPEIIRREFIVNVLDIDAELNYHSFNRDEDFADESLFLEGINPPDLDDFGDSYSELRVDTRFRPIPGVSAFSDFTVDLSNDGSADQGLGVFNNGLRLATSERWQVTLSHRFERDEDNRFGIRVSVVPCPKWRLSLQYVWDAESSTRMDVSAHVTRDLKDWVAEFGFEDDRELGYQLIAMRLRPKTSRQLIEGLYFTRRLGAGAFADGTESYTQFDY